MSTVPLLLCCRDLSNMTSRNSPPNPSPAMGVLSSISPLKKYKETLNFQKISTHLLTVLTIVL